MSMTVRQAEPGDIETIARMIGHYASQGLMLPRSLAGLAEALHNYVVADDGRCVIGCGGLEQYAPGAAEIYGLATAPAAAPPGTGSAIVLALLDRARHERLSRVFALTLAPGFFHKLGFRIVGQDDLPMKVWRDCVACPKYGNCDEIAMVLDLN
jgi:amino-acid N-acetyltransferase